MDTPHRSQPPPPPPAGGHRSFWLEQTLAAPFCAAPPLRGAHRAQVAIVGGGYVGLWTAIQIKQQRPGCDVVVLERDICGGGASGRNGGFVLSWWAKLKTLIALCGEREGLRLAHASAAAIGELGRFCAEHRIDAGLVQRGWLWTATTRAQEGAWEGTVAAAERLGIDTFVRLPPAEVAARAGSPVHRAGVLEVTGATVQPAALALGLRRVALELGVRVHEGSTVVAIERDPPPVVRTGEGSLRADRVVIAMNAWAARLRELRRAIFVVSSDLVATAPVPQRLHQIGWTGGECITDSQQMVDYYRTTDDGRIVFGKGGWGIARGGRIGARFDRDPRRARAVEADFRRVYPMLGDVPIAADWCGPIDRSTTGIPLFGRLGGRDHLLYGVGWSGNGVGPSLLGGRILASLALGRNDEWSRCGLVDQRARLFPPAPACFVGAHLVRAAVRRKENAEAHGRAPHPLAVALARLAPAGLEDH